LLAVAAVIVWEERPTLAWRVPLAVGWLFTGPFLLGFGLPLQRWPLVELAFLVGICAVAWRVQPLAPADRVVVPHELPA